MPLLVLIPTWPQATVVVVPPAAPPVVIAAGSKKRRRADELLEWRNAMAAKQQAQTAPSARPAPKPAPEHGDDDIYLLYLASL